MRHLTFFFLISATILCSSTATAQDLPLLRVSWDDPLAEVWNPPQPEQAVGETDPFTPALEVSERVRWCQEFKVRWSESSARKLFRALKHKNTSLERVDLQPWVDVQVTSRRALQPFSVHPQNSGYSVGVVPLNPNWSFSYVVAQTESGPVVASQRWPSPAELENGATCRPISSRIEFPDERQIDVAIEPFRMWGMRVADSLPADRLEASSYEALVSVIRTTDRASAGR